MNLVILARGEASFLGEQGMKTRILIASREYFCGVLEGRYFGKSDYQSLLYPIFGWWHRSSATESLNLIRILLAATPAGTLYFNRL